MIKEAIAMLVDKRNLSQEDSERVMDEVMSGKCTDAQIAGFLVALRMKGETIDEIAGCAKVMRQKASSINPKVRGVLVDTCGTGGDVSGTFNISTAAAFVVAGTGIAVAKHGNRSVSSKCGSADVLSALGVNINLEPKKVEECIEKVGFGFMFAPMFHSAMKYAGNVRKELGVRTIFNILGPLTNPASAQAQVFGAFSPQLTEPLATVLGKLGVKHAFVVHGSGLDEIALHDKTQISELKDGKVKTYEIKPQDFGINAASVEEIRGNSPEDNAKMVVDLLNGKKGPKRDIVLLNASAAIVAAGKAKDIREGIKLAEKSIDSGNALKVLEKLREFTNR